MPVAIEPAQALAEHPVADLIDARNEREVNDNLGLIDGDLRESTQHELRGREGERTLHGDEDCARISAHLLADLVD